MYLLSLEKSNFIRIGNSSVNVGHTVHVLESMDKGIQFSLDRISAT